MTTISWIYQANPIHYDIDCALKRYHSIEWLSKRYRKEVQINDKVGMWKSGINGGLIALATVTSEPKIKRTIRDDPCEKTKSKFVNPQWRVDLHFDRIFNEPIYRKKFLLHPILSQMQIFKQPFAANPFKVSTLESSALLKIIDD